MRLALGFILRKVAKTPKEIQELIENDFEYICDLDSKDSSEGENEV